MNRSTIYTISPLEKSMAKRHFFMLPPIKPFAFTMLKIIFMKLNYEVFLVMMFSENNDDCYLSNKEGS